MRVATYPDIYGIGYGSFAVHLAMDYCSGKIKSLDNMDDEENSDNHNESIDEEFFTTAIAASQYCLMPICPGK